MKIKILLFFLAVFFVGTPITAYACRCALPETSSAYKNADAVIRATATNVEEKDDKTQIATLKVSKTWKMDLTEEINVLAGGEECGHFFVKDQEYIIYLYKDGQNNYTTRNCVGNKFFNNPDLPKRFTKLAKNDSEWLNKNGKAANIIKPKIECSDSANVFTNAISYLKSFVEGISS